jgi:hypothetical protein
MKAQDDRVKALLERRTQRIKSGRMIPSAFEGRKGEVCDFDDAVSVRRRCEAARPDDVVLAIDCQIAEQ